MKKSTKTQVTNGLGTTVSEKNELLEQVPIEGTPMTAVRLEEKWFLTLGKYRLTEPMKSYEEVEEDSRRADWHRIMQVMQILIEENEFNKGKAGNTANTGNASGERNGGGREETANS